jgi:hypothetical protein
MYLLVGLLPEPYRTPRKTPTRPKHTHEWDNSFSDGNTNEKCKKNLCTLKSVVFYSSKSCSKLKNLLTQMSILNVFNLLLNKLKIEEFVDEELFGFFKNNIL